MINYDINMHNKIYGEVNPVKCCGLKMETGAEEAEGFYLCLSLSLSTYLYYLLPNLSLPISSKKNVFFSFLSAGSVNPDLVFGTDVVKSVKSIPLLKVRAGPRDSIFADRLKEELTALIVYVKNNKANDNDWFTISSNKTGTR